MRKNLISASLSSPANSVQMPLAKENGGATNTNGFFAFWFRVEVRLFPRHVMLEYFQNVDDIDFVPPETDFHMPDTVWNTDGASR